MHYKHNKTNQYRQKTAPEYLLSIILSLPSFNQDFPIRLATTERFPRKAHSLVASKHNVKPSAIGRIKIISQHASSLVQTNARSVSKFAESKGYFP